MEQMRCYGCMKMKTQSPVCEHCGYLDTAQNQRHQLPVGTVLQEQYVVGRVLGQGGFGITYLGWDKQLQTTVAIKEFFPSGIVYRKSAADTGVRFYRGEDEALFIKHRDRFLKEARILAQLSSIPEIVQIYSFFAANNTGYIVMEYVEGITLKDHIRKTGRPLTAEETFALLEPVLLGLEKVHDHHLIHRDISPDNIMLPKSGGVKLIDFGTVRMIDEAGKSRSTESVLKPGFAPIEQYNAKGNMGTWTDVYALCATYHYCMTGKLPPDAPARLESGEELPYLDRVADLTADKRRALEKGMHLRTGDRTQTLGDLHKELYEAASPKTEGTEKKKKKKWPVIAAGIALCALAAAALLFGRDNAPPAAVESVPGQTETAEITTSPADEGVTEAEEVLTYSLSENNGVYEIHGENLDIQITKQGDFKITVRGWEIRDSYTVNQTTSRRDYAEVMFHIAFNGENVYQISTVSWASDPGRNMEVNLDEMETTVAHLEEDMFWSVGFAKVSHTEDSITWTGTFPASVDLNLEELDNIEVSMNAEGIYNGRRYVRQEDFSANTGNADSALKFHGENNGVILDIAVENGRDFTVTVSGISVEEIYPVNQSGSLPDSLEYGWELTLHGTYVYKIATTQWAFDPGNVEYRSLEQMQTDVWMENEDQSGATSICNASVSYTPTSITWTGSIQEGFPFDLSSIVSATFRISGEGISDPIMLDYDLEWESSSDNITVSGVEFHADNLDIVFENDRYFTITVSGLTIQDTYLINSVSAQRNAMDYSWSVELVGPESFSVRTCHIAYDPGMEEEIPLQQMDHKLWWHDVQNNMISSLQPVEMTHTDTSITWVGMIPETYSFDFGDITEIKFVFYDNYNDLSEDRSYTVTH